MGIAGDIKKLQKEIVKKDKVVAELEEKIRVLELDVVKISIASEVKK
jgi:hypothetical protein